MSLCWAPVDIDIVDVGQRGTPPEPAQQLLEGVPRTFGDALHCPVGQVADPAREAQLGRGPLHVIAKADALDVAADVRREPGYLQCSTKYRKTAAREKTRQATATLSSIQPVVLTMPTARCVRAPQVAQ